jgi:hypothetical protein
MRLGAAKREVANSALEEEEELGDYFSYRE